MHLPEDIKKRWQEYTEELYKKGLPDPDNHSGVITHLEPDILECEIKWALRSITMNKASGGDGIPAGLFQILKDDAVQVLPVNAEGEMVSRNLKVKVAQSCLTLCNPVDYTVHGILQARILEWVAVPFSRGSSQLRDSKNTIILNRLEDSILFCF